MGYYREQVDPNRTLPDVKLDIIESYKWDHMSRDKINILHTGLVVGRCNLVSETAIDEPFTHFDGITIEEEWRGRGLGLATYILAIELSHERDLPFGTQDWGQKPGAKKIWELLAERGVATIIEPFTPSLAHEGQYQGKFRVPVAR